MRLLKFDSRKAINVAALLHLVGLSAAELNPLSDAVGKNTCDIPEAWAFSGFVGDKWTSIDDELSNHGRTIVLSVAKNTFFAPDCYASEALQWRMYAYNVWYAWFIRCTPPHSAVPGCCRQTLMRGGVLEASEHTKTVMYEVAAC